MIRLYDTMAREKRVFEPQDPKRLTMYVCGPTVYNRAHIGNARPAVVFDVLARLLRHSYPDSEVVYAANVTDIEDKIMAAAAAEAVPIGVITERYTRFYFDDLAALGVPRPDVVPFATDTIPEMIALIERLIAAGHAYAAEGHVLFDVPSWPDYGKLSRRPMDEMIAGARVDVAPYKRSPADFVLWKPSTGDQPGWESPWGRGRPGWHIECSAMIAAHLGETIDIHGGGLDLEFPHHENEIAQSSCAHGGAALARYWLHNGMLSMSEAKMSKSLGNVVTVGELLEQGHKGEVLRLALLSAHYRQPLEWSEQLIAQNKARLERMQYVGSFPADLMGPDEEFVSALADDLNTPKALQILAKLTSQCFDDLGLERSGPLSDEEEDRVFRGRGVLKASAKLLGLRLGGRMPLQIDDLIMEKLELRRRAREAGLYNEADRIRSELESSGYSVIDTATETLVMTAESIFEDDDEDFP